MKVTETQMTEIAQHAFTRMDGAWFLALAKKYGIQTAWDMDVEAWTQFSYVFGKNLRKNYIPDPVWPESFFEACDVFSKLTRMEGRTVSVRDGKIIIRVAECETQKAIAKAGVADCGIVTTQSYQGMIRGLFGNEVQVNVVHTKNLNHGAECCEVVVTRK
jgi:hypothetical protein